MNKESGTRILPADGFIRRAGPTDAAIISNIHAASWKAAYVGMVPQAYLDHLDEGNWTPRLQKDLSEGRLQADILFENGVPAGAVGYGSSRDKSHADWGEIVCIYVHPKFFRKDYGAKLLREAVKNLAQAGYRDCFLWVLAENKNAQKFYSAMGFQKTQGFCHSEIMGERLTEVRYILRGVG